MLSTHGRPAQASTFWGKLEPGPYKIGFTTIEKFDYSRTIRSRHDYFGNPVEGETDRPIQVCVWYPATEAVGHQEMVYAEYTFPFPEDESFFPAISEMQNRDVYLLHQLLQGDAGAVLNLNNMEMAAIRNAPHQEGSFPLIIYNQDLSRGIVENATMLEYLASHGFIVACTHSIGTATRDPEVNQKDLETYVRDREFAVSLMRDFPHADLGNVGTLGYGFGGLAALIHQMRYTNIRAVASLDGAITNADHAQFIRQASFYDPMRAIVPFMVLDNTGNDRPDHNLIDSLLYCPRTILSVGNSVRISMTNYSMIARGVPDSTGSSLPIAEMGHEIICQHILNFFKAHLVNDESALRFMKNEPMSNGFAPEMLSLRFAAAQDIPPTAQQFIGMLTGDKFSEALELNERFGLMSSDSRYVEENIIHGLGYQFLRRRMLDQALELFRMNTVAYPNSANAWDSFAEANLNMGNNDLAIKYYKKALEVLPNDTGITQQFRELIQTGATAALERLQQE
jgi:hypothetical protein